MKHEVTERIEHTKIQHSCDVCGTCLLVGAKPLMCEICQRETCVDCTIILDFSMPYVSVVQSLCSLCVLQIGWLDEMLDIVSEASKDIAYIRQGWAVESLPGLQP